MGEVSKILVVFSKADVTHRRMLEGILGYARDNCPAAWEIQLDLRDIFRRNTAEIKAGGFSGIIAAVANPADRKRYFASGLPTVLFEPTLARMDHARRPANNVTFFNDHAAEGRTAAEYYLARGYSSFAYVGTPVKAVWSDARRRGFAARLKKDGMHPMVYTPPSGKASTDFTLEAPRLARWLKRLPSPTALFVAHDERAQQVAAVALRAGIDIPGDLALLGVDDDELLCTTASPQLSSIPVNAEETGRRIAERMHELLRGSNSAPVVRTCHTRVIARASTDADSLTDPFVSKAVSYAEKNLSKPLRAEDLAVAANCSLRTLQTKMLRTLHRTPKEELAFLRRSEAVKLLRETRLSVSEIAVRCGYCSASHLGTHLRRSLGQTPRACRLYSRTEERMT